MAIKEVFGLFGTSIIAVIFLSLLLVIVVILLKIEKKLSKKLQVRDIDIERKSMLINGIENIPNLDNRPEKLIVYVDSYARRLFSEYLIPGKKIEYSQLSEHFTQKNQNDIASFCSEMTGTFYSGEKPSMQKIMKIVTDLREIAEKYLLQGHVPANKNFSQSKQPLKNKLPTDRQAQVKYPAMTEPIKTQNNLPVSARPGMDNQNIDNVRRKLLQKIQQEKNRPNFAELKKKTLEQSREEKEEEAKLVEYKPKAPSANLPEKQKSSPVTQANPEPKPPQSVQRAYQPDYSKPKREITIEDIDEIENLKAKIESMAQSKKRKS